MSKVKNLCAFPHTLRIYRIFTSLAADFCRVFSIQCTTNSHSRSDSKPERLFYASMHSGSNGTSSNPHTAEIAVQSARKNSAKPEGLSTPVIHSEQYFPSELSPIYVNASGDLETFE